MDKLSILKVGTSQFEIADAEARETLLTKADIDGAYPKLIAGDLVETETKDDVFTYQVTEHTGKANINSVKGNTINWNQLISDMNKTGTGTGDIVQSGTFSAISGHKYLIIVNGTGNKSYRLRDSVNSYTGAFSTSPFIWTSTLTTSTIRVQNTTTSEESYNYYFNVFDLTQMFGAGNEPTSVAEFTKLYPLPYYQYNAGELLSFNGTGIKTTGKNLLSKMTGYTANGLTSVVNEDGSITITGTASGSGGYITDVKTLDKSIPSGTIITVGFTTSLPNRIRIFARNNPQSSPTYDVNANTKSNTFALTADLNAMQLYLFTTSGTTYNFTIYPQLEFGSTATSYEAYHEETTSLPVSQYFPNGMRSAGNAYDELTPNKATTRIGVVDLGTLTWNVDPNRPGVAYTSSIAALAKENGGIMTAEYSWRNLGVPSPGIIANFNKLISLVASYGGGYAYIIDHSFDSMTASEVKTALSGKIAFYELVTPTETNVDLDLSYNTYEGGTEQLLPVNTDVPVTSPISMNVEFDFNENLTANLIKMLNCVAHVETSPSANNYAVGSYLMYNYQLYKVTSAIATGEALVEGTNITATTVMAELLALNS